jgi:hypothetical protein
MISWLKCHLSPITLDNTNFPSLQNPDIYTPKCLALAPPCTFPMYIILQSVNYVSWVLALLYHVPLRYILHSYQSTVNDNRTFKVLHSHSISIITTAHNVTQNRANNSTHNSAVHSTYHKHMQSLLLPVPIPGFLLYFQPMH